MSKKVKRKKSARLVREAMQPVIDKNIKLLTEIRRPNKAMQNYDGLSSVDRSKLKHIPVFVNHPYHKGEFEVFFSHPNYIKEGKEDLYPPTQSSRSTINLVKSQYRPYEIEIDIQPNYRNKKDPIARAIMVSMNNTPEMYVFEDKLLILDDLFKSCGYFRACADRVYEKEGLRVIQYEPYHYETYKRLTIPKMIYHITTRDNRDDIIENGFIAHGSKESDGKKFYYPPRNFFFTKHNEDLIINYMYIAEKVKMSNIDNNETTLFHIDTSGLKHIKFYSDPLYNEKEAVYTYEDISPEHIDHYIDILI